MLISLFFFDDTATPDIYTNGPTLSLHVALPITEHRHGDAAAGRNADQPGAHAVAPGRRTFGVPVPLAATHCLPSLPSASASLRATALALSAGSPITCT